MQQARISPSASSSVEICARLIGSVRYFPPVTRTRHIPQPPRRQPTGSLTGKFFSRPNPCARSSDTSTRSCAYPDASPLPSTWMGKRSAVMSKPPKHRAFRLLGAVLRGEESLGENVLLEQAALHQSRDASFDHRRRPA